MKPKRIFLIRHGQSVGNVDRSIHATVPDWKIPLTEKGHQQAIEAGYNLSSELGNFNLMGVYLSPYIRTRETWNQISLALAKDNCPISFVKEDVRLREQEWGSLRAYEPRTWGDIEAERDAYGTLFYRFIHGESGCDVFDRCTTFLETIHRDFANCLMPSNVLIVTHGYTLRVLLMRWLHWSVEEFHQLSNPRNCERFELRLDPDTDKYSLVTPFPTNKDRQHHEIV